MDASAPPLAELARAFALPGSVASAQPLRRGHIHETHVVTCEGGARFVAQGLNTHVFRDAGAVMANLVRVTDHVRARLLRAGVADVERRVLRVLATREGATFWVDAQERTWRCFPFVEGTRSHDRPGSPDQARRAARAFGDFAAALSDLDPPPVDTVPRFHDFAHRFEALEAAARADASGRADAVRADLDAAARLFETIASRHDLGALPPRVVHNDCKLNNLLFDVESDEALCVVDLDTVMRGSLVYDFGELVRTASCRATEDESDLARVRPVPDFLDALARGYLEGVRPIVTGEEVRALALAGARLALENGLRFLTDHLEGDLYFPAHRPGQNLDRHRAQRRLAEALVEAEPRIARALAGASTAAPTA